MTTPTIDTLDEILLELVKNFGGKIQKLPSMTPEEARTKILAEITKARIDELTKLYGFSDSGLMFPSEYLKIRLGELRAGLSGGQSE